METQNQILDRLERIEATLSGLSSRPLTFTEATKYLNISASYLYKLTATQEVPCYKPRGKRLYFDKSELDAWLKRSPVRNTSDLDQLATDYVVSGKGGRK
jgi:excisionase family DNA binding protein